VRQLVKVSLIILTYNVPRYIAEAVESVLAQTYRDFELILWDDGSTDPAVLPILRDFEKRDPRVRVIVGEHAGEQVARQQAIEQSTGEYLGWVDSDDRLAPAALEKTVALLDARPDIGMVYTDHTIIDADGNSFGLSPRCAIPYSPERLLIDFMTFQFRLMRRSVFDRAGGYLAPGTIRAATDYDLCLRISEIAAIHHLAEPLFFYRRHSGQISHVKRMEQIEESRAAIERALVRRGLADRVRIEVQLKSTFRLVRRKVRA
jgi:glycosyltransferase involved in cell wall biosynthesis